MTEHRGINKDSNSDEQLKSIFALKNIAMVGMSIHEEKPASFVPTYLIENGYNVIPVNPTSPEILGRKSYLSILTVPDVVDVVDLFRPSEEVLPVVKDALRKGGVKVIWMQKGISNLDAEREAKQQGLIVVYNRCMMLEHTRLCKNQ